MKKLKAKKNLLLKSLFYTGRILTVAIAIFALVAAGASAVTRLSEQKTVDQSNESELTLIEKSGSISMVSEPDEAPDGMTTDSKPWSEPSALIQSYSLIFSGSSQFRFWQTKSIFSISENRQSLKISESKFSKTVGEVLWSLGRQFTLVGAKPSGTS